ncbi:unnamed protein product [Rotaria sordida]|uniref:AMP deaminase n=1 Tax=Rotaria sordida TaxID=392033 RepID=A0A814BYH8_9BILA|nr:unnamed protein product [Rotaria sordida]
MKVYKKQDGTILTLKGVFDELKININEIDVDLLGVHADRNTFKRFDRFNANYNPVGQTMLREIFMKPNNYINGVFFAEMLKEVIVHLETSKYQHAELRVSIQGRSMDEWDQLATWFLKNKMHSTNVNYMIQVPRVFNVHYASGKLKNFQELLTNLFQPLFDATINPESHPDLFRFMRYFTGFDSVDDESKPERSIITSMTYPDQWNTNENPPYAYYLFYMYANILALNQLRRSRGLNTYQFRPHCGEAGDASHLTAAYILAENISHGLVLREKKVEVSSDMKVYKKQDGTILTLKGVFDELKININEIDVDLLGVHADRNTFQRFDRFNANYNPVGQTMLRDIFMKTNNYIGGVFFAEMLKRK